MEIKTINRRKTSFFSELANTINDQQKEIQKYLRAPFSIAEFKKQIEFKKANYSATQRAITYKVLTNQLHKYIHFPKVQKNIEFIKDENTFTITSGHQLNLFGGPLYTAYKILDSIRLTEKLKQEYPTYNFVPVFWMATEDHDFEEINHLQLFQDKFSWATTQQGAVGRFSLEGIEKFKEEISTKFENNPDFSVYLNQFYKGDNLAEATREFLMDLFGDYGLLIIDADEKALKESFLPIFRKELEEEFSEKLILETITELEKDGFHGQAMPRPINLFYLRDQFRERIIPIDEENYEIGTEKITKANLLLELRRNPESFSPNVVLRPLYQETILPNLCYIGGGGEMAYWLELKSMFEEADVLFPLLKVRNSIQIIDENSLKRMEQLDLEIEDFFNSIHETKKKFVFHHAEEELDFIHLDEATHNLSQLVVDTITNVDKGLERYAQSEITRIQNQISVIQQKVIRHQKKKFDESMGKIDGIYSRLFPQNGLQERFENIIPYLAKYGKKEFIQLIYNAIRPEEEELILLLEK